ncbi:MAG: hypothetical protein EOO01_02995 [Chitinophagaceae bacterium]|nr:MAG: hypothetical protein EOO01_02995 [Chitinophagaceae bacterium]
MQPGFIWVVKFVSGAVFVELETMVAVGLSWSDLSELAIRAHVNGIHSIDVDMKIYLGEEGLNVIEQGGRPQQFLETEDIPTHWPTVEQQQELLAQFSQG